ncbi:MAG: hypothetical protein VW339_03250 [Quisquiliibacterium sp.]
MIAPKNDPSQAGSSSDSPLRARPAGSSPVGEPELPVLPTMGVGSLAVPGWFAFLGRHLREGAFGEADRDELFDDMLRLAVQDQIDAGLDILSDGEFRNQRLLFELHERLTGLRQLETPRKLGVYGHDQMPRFEVIGSIDAPQGLGIVQAFERLRQAAPGRALKVALPGPLSLASMVHGARRSDESVLDDLVRLVRREVEHLLQAGAYRIQIDEPCLAHPTHGLSLTAAAQMVNRCMEGTSAHFGVHICFGNRLGRPVSNRDLLRLMPALEMLIASELVIEFANREMAQVELLASISDRFHIAAGVVDVNSFHLESAQDVAERLRLVLAHLPQSRVIATADCGFSALPRQLALAKMRALVQGAAIVRTKG